MNDEGGSAFPYDFGDRTRESKGMTLRDYFAAQALQGLIAGGELGAGVDDLAKTAFKAADAMLRRREQ